MNKRIKKKKGLLTPRYKVATVITTDPSGNKVEAVLHIYNKENKNKRIFDITKKDIEEAKALYENSSELRKIYSDIDEIVKNNSISFSDITEKEILTTNTVTMAAVDIEIIPD